MRNLTSVILHTTLLLCVAGAVSAQTAAASVPETSGSETAHAESAFPVRVAVRLRSGEETITLSPFTVTSEKDEGYRATNTLSGTRMNASLFQTPAPISVLTKEFLDDVGAYDISEMLKYAPGSDHERTNDTAGVLQQAYSVRASIRGFSESTATRDFMPNMIEDRGVLATDRFNVDRADMNRGPNSVLYGTSRPGGALNTTSKRAILNGRQKSAALTIGSWNRTRSELDLALPLVTDKLALRVNAVAEDREGWWEFEMMKQKGLALASTYQPFQSTQVRVGVERMVRDQNQGGAFPHADLGYSRWVKAGSPAVGNPLLPGTNPAPGLLVSTNTLQVVYAPQIRAQPFRLSTTGADMRPDLPGAQPTGYWVTVTGPAAPSGGTATDPFYGQVLPANARFAGSGATSNYDYTIYNLFLDQRIGGLNIELGYRRTDYYRLFPATSAEVLGEPNPVLPGAYFADGDSAVAAGRLPGTLLPDIGRVNTFVGLPYVQGQVIMQDHRAEYETMRAAVSYELDLRKTSEWLGRHRVAGFWQRDDDRGHTGQWGEYNLTPNNSQPIDSATNTILRRTYLDFSTPGGLRGQLDPRENPIPSMPGFTAGEVFRGPQPVASKKASSGMVAIQSYFLRDRLTFTAGYRRDRVEVNQASQGGVRLQNSSNLWSVRHYIFDAATATSFSGSTKTIGAVLSPWEWLGLSYNQSQSVFPQSNLNILRGFLPPIQGRGRDIGVRFNLLEGRLSAGVNFFTNVGANQISTTAGTPRTQAVPALNAIIDTLVRQKAPLPPTLIAAGQTQLEGPTSRETIDGDGRGAEIEVIGRISRGLSVSLNYSRNRLVQTRIAPDMNGFLASVKGMWNGNLERLDNTPGTVATYVRARDNTPNRDFVLDPATFNDAYAYAVSVMDLVNVSEGKAPLSQIASSFNCFASYRFDNDAWFPLKRARAGVGANYRGPAVIGYDATKGNSPFLGQSSATINLMLGKQFALRKGQMIDVQLNVDNVFKQEDLLPFSAVSPGNVVRYILPATRQNWNLRATYSF